MNLNDAVRVGRLGQNCAYSGAMNPRASRLRLNGVLLPPRATEMSPSWAEHCNLADRAAPSKHAVPVRVGQYGDAQIAAASLPPRVGLLPLGPREMTSREVLGDFSAGFALSSSMPSLRPRPSPAPSPARTDHNRSGSFSCQEALGAVLHNQKKAQRRQRDCARAASQTQQPLQAVVAALESERLDVSRRSRDRRSAAYAELRAAKAFALKRASPTEWLDYDG